MCIQCKCPEFQSFPCCKHYFLYYNFCTCLLLSMINRIVSIFNRNKDKKTTLFACTVNTCLSVIRKASSVWPLQLKHCGKWKKTHHFKYNILFIQRRRAPSNNGQPWLWLVIFKLPFIFVEKKYLYL